MPSLNLSAVFQLNFCPVTRFLQISLYLKEAFNSPRPILSFPFLGCCKELTTIDRIFNYSVTGILRMQKLTFLTGGMLTESFFFLRKDASQGQQDSLQNVEIRSKFPPSVEGIRALKRAAHSHVKSCRVEDNLTDDRLTMLHRICWKDTTDG